MILNDNFTDRVPNFCILGEYMIRGLLTLAFGFVLINLPGQVLLAQGIPTPTLLVNTRCSVGHGYSINDVLEVARSDAGQW